ncbi:pyridoxamine 5'-phosphate oxidase-domain-containing protein [Apiosordaria backusii]|uniref:Pyridoxamine 5'-phosphate oxidase-domain-containing protein n=1 Tax=Apiosordaria backusii TaxID=314023 RepID=A0AA40E3N5_9PEZI|nr:pyridoxamine 5'-phosphate oxidase-domain-containing protein [Apiosordaria backusii]
MKPSTLFSTLLPLTSAYSIPKEDTTSNNAVKIPTARESAILARRILTLTPLGTISTIFPSTSSSRNPPGTEGKPHALMEYISACDPLYPSHPTLLSLNISSTFKNIASGSNLSLAITWTPPPLPPPSRSLLSHLNPFSHDIAPQPQFYSAVALPRYSLMGYLEPIPGADDPKSDAGKQVQGCYTAIHPDAKYWLPGNRIHESHFVRLVVTEIYWVGGFGDRAYIGWINASDWESVTKEEIERVRLPGEKPLEGKDL